MNRLSKLQNFKTHAIGLHAANPPILTWIQGLKSPGLGILYAKGADITQLWIHNNNSQKKTYFWFSLNLFVYFGQFMDCPDEIEEDKNYVDEHTPSFNSLEWGVGETQNTF